MSNLKLIEMTLFAIFIAIHLYFVINDFKQSIKKYATRNPNPNPPPSTDYDFIYDAPLTC